MGRCSESRIAQFDSLPHSGFVTREKEGKHMHYGALKLYVKFQTLASSEDGQDLVEYALLCCLIALAAITGVNYVATAVTTVFTNISSSLA
jgi:Flp pilus assembly pilin Flp